MHRLGHCGPLTLLACRGAWVGCGVRRAGVEELVDKERLYKHDNTNPTPDSRGNSVTYIR